MYLVIDTVSGIILEESDIVPEFNEGWMGIRKDGMFTQYSSHPVIRVKQVSKETYDDLVESAREQGVDTGPVEDYDDDGISEEQRAAFHQKYMGQIFNNQ